MRRRGVRAGVHAPRRKSVRGVVHVRWQIVLCVAALIAGMVVLDSAVHPALTTLATYQARVYASQAVNGAIEEELAKLGVTYDDLVHVQRDDGGEVTSIETDMLTINTLKAKLTNQITETLSGMGQDEIKIPIGSIIGGGFFYGRGPSIPLKMVPAGYAQTQFENRFEAAGINQTRHQVVVNVQVSISILIPGCPVDTQVESSLCVAETVIVGRIPEGYTVITGDDSSIQSKINDYGAYEDHYSID